MFGYFYKKIIWESLFCWIFGVIKSYSILRRIDSEWGIIVICLGRFIVMSVSKLIN